MAAISPKLYEQFTVREDSVSVRFLQHEATVEKILDHPLFGVGLNNGTSQKAKYAKEPCNKYDLIPIGVDADWYARGVGGAAARNQ